MENEELHFALVDDDSRTREKIAQSLREIFSKLSYVALITPYASAKEYLEALQDRSFDLTFLDIEMPDMDGITMVKELIQEGKKGKIIYVSNREDLIFDSLETRPFGFVRKSNFLKDISKVIEAFLEDRKNKADNTLIVSSRDGNFTLDISDIVYIESRKHKQLIHIAKREETLEASTTLTALSDALMEKGFINIYKGIIVNYLYIRRFDEDTVELKDNSTIPLSRRKSKEAKEKYMGLMKRDMALIL